MATATPYAPTKIGELLDCEVVYETDGKATFKEHVNGKTFDEIRSKAKIRLDELNADGSDELKRLESAIGQPFDFTPDPVPEPTPAEVFSVEFQKYLFLKQIVDSGVSLPKGVDIAAQLETVNAKLAETPEIATGVAVSPVSEIIAK